MGLRTIALLGCLAMPALAHAQPSDPYKQRKPEPPPNIPVPTPEQLPPPRPGDDVVLAEQVARTIVQRAQELFDARVYVDAKQLAVEALVRSPRGAAAEQARFLIRSINQQLGISDDAPKPIDPPPVDLTPIGDSTRPVTAPLPPIIEPTPERGGSVRTRTMVSTAIWGGVMGGLFADAIDVDGTTGSDIAIGAAVGAGLGGLTGSLIARKQYTRGDIALVDTFAGIGTVGGLTLGMLMQPAESEAYSVNAMLGVVGGLAIGYIAAPETNTTQRRMIRVAGIAAIGGALPFLLYAGIYDDTSTGDERLVGGLATTGLVIGTYLGFRLTGDIDVGLDVRDGAKPAASDAPAALVGRHSDGRWSAGSLAVQPLSRTLAPQRGMLVPLVGARF
ncbi:MAG: hypothetical protein H0T89_12805 [Deltaproteobacteria bacterium]|nr:hypothetical protein [Deltaproteobacteria bacterium]MDQ3364093.1 hypothetical protein [Myxococcota bacterium]